MPFSLPQHCPHALSEQLSLHTKILEFIGPLYKGRAPLSWKYELTAT